MQKAASSQPQARLERMRGDGPRTRATRFGRSEAEVARAASRVSRTRVTALGSLEEAFASGSAPSLPLSGEYRGRLLTTTIWGPLDALTRVLSRLYLPWRGKWFDPQRARGENVFTPSARFVGHIPWPLYFSYSPYRDGLYSAFEFRTSLGGAAGNPSLKVLRLEYDLKSNPRFLVRSVLDELVEVSPGQYLGRAFLRFRGRLHLAAYFTLSDLERGLGDEE